MGAGVKVFSAKNYNFKGSLTQKDIFRKYVCLSQSHMHAGAYKGQKGVLDPMKWDLQAVLSCPAWVLGIELMFSRRAVSVLNH